MIEVTVRLVAWLKKWCLILGAFVCFGCVLWLVLAMKDAAGGTLMAGLFVVLVLMHSIPEMESFKAFSIEAKWRQKLTEADQIIASLRATLTMFGKLTYHQFGWGSRISHPVREKQKLASELDSLLRTNGVSEADITAMKDRYIHFALYDINAVFQRIKERLAGSQYAKLKAEANNARLMDPTRYAELQAKADRMRGYADPSGAESFPRVGFLDWCIHSLPPSELLDASDDKILKGFAERCGKAGEACVQEGRLTEEGLQIIEALNTDNTFVKLFGRKP